MRKTMYDRLNTPPSPPPWAELDCDAARQYIDASASFTAWEDTWRQAASPDIAGTMSWRKRQADRDYLIRTTADVSQKSLGWRTPETEQLYKDFTESKEMAVIRLKGLTAALVCHQRMNKALYVGQAPRQLIDSLSSLPANAVVTSDHALYAYAAAAGVRLRSDLYPPLLPSGSGADLVGLKWEIVDPGPDTVRSCIHLEPLGSRRDYEKSGKDRLTAVIGAKTGHMARMNAISPVEFVERRRGSGSLSGPTTGQSTEQLEIIEDLEGLVREYLVG
jgi:hypothetical protein